MALADTRFFSNGARPVFLKDTRFGERVQRLCDFFCKDSRSEENRHSRQKILGFCKITVDKLQKV